ncbi:hypothetical protein D3C81_941060 [compost metagenome]
MPDRTVRHQRIPTPGAPRFSDAVTLQHQVRHTEFAQVFAHGDASLAGTDNKRIYFYLFIIHACVLQRGDYGAASRDRSAVFKIEYRVDNFAGGVGLLCLANANSENMIFVVVAHEKTNQQLTSIFTE